MNKKQDNPDHPFKFSKKSLILLAVSAAVIIAGFILLAMGDIYVAPILLVIGYVGIIPAAIMKK